MSTGHLLCHLWRARIRSLTRVAVEPRRSEHANYPLRQRRPPSCARARLGCARWCSAPKPAARARPWCNHLKDIRGVCVDRHNAHPAPRLVSLIGRPAHCHRHVHKAVKACRPWGRRCIADLVHSHCHHSRRRFVYKPAMKVRSQGPWYHMPALVHNRRRFVYKPAMKVRSQGPWCQ